MRVHFIAIGGSAMHNLAIALKKKGWQVTGSDDQIFSPAKERLQSWGLLPDYIGWKPEKITKDLDCVILGMHAKEDNPELLKAKDIGLKIYSYPEFLYHISKDKIRIVIGGSHGKTTTTAMILHAFKCAGIDTDYMVGALLEGFDVMVKMSDEAKYMVLEGDEYLTSPIDKRPKFHLYKPNIAVITGIAWDHVNVFPTFDIYKQQFEIFTQKVEKDGVLIYCAEDKQVCDVVSKTREDIKQIPYKALTHKVENNVTYVIYNNKVYRMMVFGHHNLMNMSAAMQVCEQVGIKAEDFLFFMQSFKGASKRLETVKQNQDSVMFKDFAHSPSKLLATIEAIKEQYPNRRLVAVMELHTYSSLTEEFLQQYKGTMDKADRAIVYYNHHALELKRLPELSKQKVYQAFAKEGLEVLTSTDDLKKELEQLDMKNTCLLMSSSGDFDGLDMDKLADKIIR